MASKKSVEKRKANRTKIEKVFHDFFTDRWNGKYHSMKEPGWGISSDVTDLILGIRPRTNPAEVKQILKHIERVS